MPSQIDYVIAAGVFLAAFLFVTAFVNNYAASSFATLETTNLREGALAVLNGIDRNPGLDTKITDIALGTDAYTFQIQIPTTASGKNESTSFRLAEVGFPNADRNSVSIYDGDISLAYTLAGDFYTFNAEIPPEGKTIAVWFDDDSRFSPKASAIPILEDLLPHQLFQVERARVVQYAQLERLQQTSYIQLKEDFDFRIRLITTRGLEDFSYGADPPPTNVIALQRPILYQTQNADVIKGYMIVEAW